MANILANTIIGLKAELVSLLAGQGKLVLSGILCEQTADIMQAFPDFDLLESETENDWAMLILAERNESHGTAY
jgi:ribosomal protein L11 methylase PrmA